MTYRDLIIIGAGPAGLAVAVGAYEAGLRDILIIERENAPGGILRQCIHNGFGLHIFGEELTGPEYAQRYIDKINELKIEYVCDTLVMDISEKKIVSTVSTDRGIETISAGAIVLAMGCRERPRGALAIPGTRPSGIYSAGTAQQLVNMSGYMPGKKIVILGSGDIGLIMARRMIFSGAEVVACVELMPYSAGLNRNIVQCLHDYNIPLLTSHTVTEIHGQKRLTGVTISKVDENLRPIPGTEQLFECDTLLLSVGLIPENELSAMAGVELCPHTSGAIVDEQLRTNVPGIFSCGNVLHVHDLVDFVSAEAHIAGVNAAKYLNGALSVAPSKIAVISGFGVSGAVPQFISDDAQGDVSLMFRPRGVYRNARVKISQGGVELYSKKHKILTPGEMVSLKFDSEKLDKLEAPHPVEIAVEVQ